MGLGGKCVSAKENTTVSKRKGAKPGPKPRKSSKIEKKSSVKQTAITTFFGRIEGPSAVCSPTTVPERTHSSPASSNSVGNSGTLSPPPFSSPVPPPARKLTYNVIPVPDPALDHCSMDLLELAKSERAGDAIVPSAGQDASGTGMDIEREQAIALSRLRHLDTSLDDAGRTDSISAALKPESMSTAEEKKPVQTDPNDDDSLNMLACDESSIGVPAIVTAESNPTAATTAETPARPNVDCDGDSLMSTPVVLGASLRSLSDARSTGDALAEDSDSDSDAELEAEAAAIRAAQAASKPPRRSARIAANEEADPYAFSFSGAVFPERGAGSARRATQMSTTLKALLRERNRREKEQEKLDELRDDLCGEGVPDEEEQFFAMMAASENRNEAERAALHEKYHSPVAMFLAPLEFPPRNNVHWVRPRKNTHPLHDMLLTACGGDENSSMVVFESQVQFLCKAKMPPPNFVAKMLFHRVVYDPTEGKPGAFSREQELQSLLTIISHATKELPLSSMLTVFHSFGARFDENNARPNAVDDAPEGSLDKRVTEKGNGLPSDAELSLRNMGRAFCVWTAQVDSEMDLCTLFGRKLANMDHFLETETYCLAIVQLCVQLLLSPFGSRLKIPVSRLIEAILDRVDDSAWTLFRQRAAKGIIGLTSRLGLHCELVTYLLPIRTMRTRHLGLDIAFLSLRQWHAGPGANPIPKDIDFVWPESAMKKKEDGISFTIADILNCMESIPEFGKDTDVVWACGIARILKQVTIESDVLATRQGGEIARIQGIIKKMRVCSHRMSFGVPLQDMRLALDALLSAMKGFLGNSKSVKKELHPFAKDEPVQRSIVSMFGNPKK